MTFSIIDWFIALPPGDTVVHLPVWSSLLTNPTGLVRCVSSVSLVLSVAERGCGNIVSPLDILQTTQCALMVANTTCGDRWRTKLIWFVCKRDVPVVTKWYGGVQIWERSMWRYNKWWKDRVKIYARDRENVRSPLLLLLMIMWSSDMVLIILSLVMTATDGTKRKALKLPKGEELRHRFNKTTLE